MKYQTTFIREVASLSEEADLMPEDAGGTYRRTVMFYLSFIAVFIRRFASRSSIAEADAYQSKRFNWVKILSRLSKQTEDHLSLSFEAIPISIDARVDQMKWADWAKILSNIAKWAEERFPLGVEEYVDGARPAVLSAGQRL